MSILKLFNLLRGESVNIFAFVLESSTVGRALAFHMTEWDSIFETSYERRLAQPAVIPDVV